MGVNQIFELLISKKQTGLNYKWDLLDTIFYLEKCKFIIKRQDPNHSQRFIIDLTDYGKDLAILKSDASNICLLLRKISDSQRILLGTGNTKDTTTGSTERILTKGEMKRLQALRQVRGFEDPFYIKNYLLDDLPVAYYPNFDFQIYDDIGAESG